MIEHPLPQRDFDPSVTGPLTGIRVLDLGRLVAGGHCSVVLGDLGADIIKVERPGGGDELRGNTTDGIDAYFRVYGRNKRSIVIDLSVGDGRDLLLKMAEDCDVLIENFRPGTLEKLGLAPKTLLKHNANLVIVRISGWGQTGPYSHRPGFGTLGEAVSGFMLRNGEADRPPVAAPTALADMIAGLYASNAALAAVLNVRAGGKGQVVDVSLFEPLFSMMGPDALLDQLGSLPVRGEGPRASSIKGTFHCADSKWVAISAGTETTVERLLCAINRPDLLSDPRFAGHRSRLDHRKEMNAIIQEWLGSRTRDSALEELHQKGVTIAPLYDMPDILRDEHFRARDVVVEVTNRGETLRSIRMHNIVPKMSGTPSGFRYAAPRLGEHTTEILKDFGFSEERIRTLLSGHVIEMENTNE